jgi:hypothetical protein
MVLKIGEHCLTKLQMPLLLEREDVLRGWTEAQLWLLVWPTSPPDLPNLLQAPTRLGLFSRLFSAYLILLLGVLSRHP